MKPWKTKTRRTILNEPPWLAVERHSVELPDGRLLENWQWIITPDYINVVAVTETGHFLCFRQVKYGIAWTTLAIVGGYINEGE
jgi:ADP-ribose pyrophosphatase